MISKTSKDIASFRLRRGMLFGLAQALGTIVSQLLLIRILIEARGLEELGLWALATAISAPLRLFDFAGFSSSYFVARSVASGDATKDTAAYIQCNMLASFCLLLASVSVLALVGPFAADLLLAADQAGAVLDVLPVVMIATIAQSLSLNLATALDGLQKSFLRSSAVILGTIFYFFVSISLIRPLGIVGIAIGQIAMAAVTGSLSAFFLAKRLPLISAPDWRIIGKKLREILAYGVRMQSVNWSQGLFEPTVRLVLGSSSGLLFLGAYEAAQRVLSQGRSLVSQMLYPLVPAITHLREASPARASHFIWLWHKRCALVSIFLSPVVLFMPDLVATILLGKPDANFTRIFHLLSIPAWYAISTFPLYYLGPATSLFRWNALGSAAALLALPLIALALKLAGTGDNVIWGAAISSVIGLLISTTANIWTAKLPYLRHVSLSIFVLCIVATINLIAYEGVRQK